MKSLLHHSSESGSSQDQAVESMFSWRPHPDRIAVGDVAGAGDQEVPLQNNLMRHFDPTLGQWLSEEPLSFAAGDENLRKYVGQ